MTRVIPARPASIILPRAFLMNGVMVDRTTIARRARRVEVQGRRGHVSTEPEPPPPKSSPSNGARPGGSQAQGYVILASLVRSDA